jgi:hypothetical protein
VRRDAPEGEVVVGHDRVPDIEIEATNQSGARQQTNAQTEGPSSRTPVAPFHW